MGLIAGAKDVGVEETFHQDLGDLFRFRARVRVRVSSSPRRARIG